MKGFSAGRGAPGQARNIAAGGYPSQDNPSNKGAPSPTPMPQQQTAPAAQGQVGGSMQRSPDTTMVGFGQDLAQASADNPNAFGQQDWVDTPSMQNAGSNVSQYAPGLGNEDKASVQEKKDDTASPSYIPDGNDNDDNDNGNGNGNGNGNSSGDDIIDKDRAARDEARRKKEAMMAERGLEYGVPSRQPVWEDDELRSIGANTEKLYRAMYDWWTGPRAEAWNRLQAGEINTGEFQNIIGRAMFDLTAHYGFDHRNLVGSPGNNATFSDGRKHEGPICPEGALLGKPDSATGSVSRPSRPWRSRWAACRKVDRAPPTGFCEVLSSS